MPSSSIHPPPETKEIDALFELAGLVRHSRGPRSARKRPAKFERVTAEELSETAPAPQIAANGVAWLAAPRLDKLDWLWHGFSTRRGGVSRCYGPEGTPGELNLGLSADDERKSVLTNRRLLAEAITGGKDTPLALVRQIHSNRVVMAGASESKRKRTSKGDGLMTAEPGVLLGIQTADCIPVLVADRKRHAVAAFHAGWRGTAERIVEKGIGRMRLEFGSRPEDLVAAIGPGIGQCCYAVGEDLLSAFESQFAYARELFREVYSSDPIKTRYPMLFLTQRAPGHSPIGPGLHLDLKEANRRQLLDAGVKAASIVSIGGCTACQPELFFSHRASQGRAGRMLSVVGIRP